MPPELRILTADDLVDLRPALIRCLAGLAAHHNRVALIYPGMYPLHDFDHTIDAMIEQLHQNKTCIAGLFWSGLPQPSTASMVGGLHKNIEKYENSTIAPVSAQQPENILAGFCQATVSGRHGSLDYMYLDERLRGQGYGTLLMDWAMQVFALAHVRSVDTKVVLGNDAQAFYEKYGFKTRAVVMAKVFNQE